MESLNQNLSSEQITELLAGIRALDLVDYLATLGHYPDPKKTKGQNYWYNSPLRHERTPSFKVNREKNVWVDYGAGPDDLKHLQNTRPGQKPRTHNGGTTIDFAMQYNDWTIGELINSFKDAAGIFLQPQERQHPKQQSGPQEAKIKVINERSLYSYPLLDYLKERRIPMKIYDRYCKEIAYEYQGRQYYAIGVKNDSGGYALRNSIVKLATIPNDHTTIDNGSKKAVVFEGFFDFLSFHATYPNLPEKAYNYVILNSLSFFEKARTFMERHDSIHLYLDQGKSGQAWTKYALELDAQKYKDQSQLYKGYDDFNDWLINFGKAEKKTKSVRIG